MILNQTCNDAFLLIMLNLQLQSGEANYNHLGAESDSSCYPPVSTVQHAVMRLKAFKSEVGLPLGARSGNLYHECNHPAPTVLAKPKEKHGVCCGSVWTDRYVCFKWIPAFFSRSLNWTQSEEASCTVGLISRNEI